MPDIPNYVLEVYIALVAARCTSLGYVLELGIQYIALVAARSTGLLTRIRYLIHSPGSCQIYLVTCQNQVFNTQTWQLPDLTGYVLHSGIQYIDLVAARYTQLRATQIQVFNMSLITCTHFIYYIDIVFLISSLLLIFFQKDKKILLLSGRLDKLELDILISCFAKQREDPPSLTVQCQR